MPEATTDVFRLHEHRAELGFGIGNALKHIEADDFSALFGHENGVATHVFRVVGELFATRLNEVGAVTPVGL